MNLTFKLILTKIFFSILCLICSMEKKKNKKHIFVVFVKFKIHASIPPLGEL